MSSVSTALYNGLCHPSTPQVANALAFTGITAAPLSGPYGMTSFLLGTSVKLAHNSICQPDQNLFSTLYDVANHAAVVGLSYLLKKGSSVLSENLEGAREDFNIHELRVNSLRTLASSEPNNQFKIHGVGSSTIAKLGFSRAVEARNEARNTLNSYNIAHQAVKTLTYVAPPALFAYNTFFQATNHTLKA